MKKILKSKDGQSLVEVVVACGIIGIALVAMMSIMTASKNLLYTSEDQMKATALAQEGIEIAKHQRDIGCSFTNITDANGNLTSNEWYIKSDIDGTDDETLVSSGTPNEIDSFDGFSRYIYIEELSSMSNITGININNSGFIACSNSQTDYDCTDKYYAMKVEVYKGDKMSGQLLSHITTIISKQ